MGIAGWDTMTFLTPITALIGAAIAVPLLVSLYFLKLRRRRLEVSSTLLWKKAIHDLQVNAPFQKLRRNLLLVLQLLILTALLLALARPTWRGAARPGERLILVIDHSASMNASDVAPSRLEKAKARALQLIDDLNGQAMVISFARHARVLQPATTDRALLRAAVREIAPTDQQSNLDMALRLVSNLIHDGVAAENLKVYVYSDGQVGPSAGVQLPTDQLVFVRMGLSGDESDDGPRNLALVSLAARRDLKDPSLVQLFAQLANYGPDPVETNVTLRLNDTVARVAPVTIAGAIHGGAPARQSVQFEFNLGGSALLEVQHDHQDHLSADDSARLLLAPPRWASVLLVSPGNAFLRRAIEAVGVRRLVELKPQDYELMDVRQIAGAGQAGSGFDILVFDGCQPTKRPPLPALFFGADPVIEGLKLVPPEPSDPQAQLVLNWKREHELMQHVWLDDVVLTTPGRLELPAQAQVLITGQAGPLAAELTHDGVRTVVTSFALLKSNWAMQVSFPVFINNVVRWLAPGQESVVYRPGEVAVVPTHAQATRLRFVGPQVLTADVSQLRAVLPAFERVGIYQADQGVPAPWARLAVSLLDEQESDIRPAERLRVGTVAVAHQSGSGAIRREILRYLGGAALVVLMIEWLVYTRRMHL